MQRRFTSAVLDRIESAVRAAEKTHRGEVRVVIETDLDAWSILSDKPPRIRALEVFAQHGVWDTAENNGILLYVLFADRDVEIVADRGYTGAVQPQEWESVCRAMEAEFRAARWEHGVIAGIERASALAARHFPARSGPADPADVDELPNRPLLM